jgi:AcrR family transcriptional regulator
MRRRLLDAAVRVLRDEGALGFTTTRVADEAGVSVGSLYQYFPNKHALVVAIHREQVEAGWVQVQSILDRAGEAASSKVTEIARWFFVTEAAEAAGLGGVFDDIEVFLREGGDPVEAAHVEARFARFLAEHSPRRRTEAELRFDARLLITTIESVGKAVAPQPASRRERERWATEVAAMLNRHLDLP